MKTDKDITIKSVDQTTWDDFESLFESKGGPSYCWCMVWREIEKGKSRSSKSDKKEALKNCVDHNIPVGLLAYKDSEPIAWCSIAPRDTYRSLGGDETKEDVWSLVCFFIKKEYRRQHMSVELITAALKYAKRNGAKYVEAYPVKTDSPSYRFMGFVKTFEKAGFSFVKKAGTRRHVMTCKL